jgi:hypothetical protein
MAITRFPSFVIDCPDAAALAGFYGALLGWNAKPDDGWVEIRPDDGSSCISFQEVDGYQAPVWPGQARTEQMHLDLVVVVLDEGEQEAIRLGATKAETQPGTTFRVFLDPAGHPFCLCLS